MISAKRLTLRPRSPMNKATRERIKALLLDLLIGIVGVAIFLVIYSLVDNMITHVANFLTSRGY